MDVELVQQNVLTFLGAGQVTTSSALAWVSLKCVPFDYLLMLEMQLWFCLSTFPSEARKLYASLIAAGLRKDKEITADELAKLEYLDWVGCQCRIQQCKLMFLLSVHQRDAASV